MDGFLSGGLDGIRFDCNTIEIDSIGGFVLLAAGVLQSSNPTEETAGEKSQAGSANAQMRKCGNSQSNNSGLPPIVIQRLLDLIAILEFGAVIQLIF